MISRRTVGPSEVGRHLDLSNVAPLVCDFREALLQGVYFEKAQLQGAEFSASEIFPEAQGLTWEQLRSASDYTNAKSPVTM